MRYWLETSPTTNAIQICVVVMIEANSTSPTSMRFDMIP